MWPTKRQRINECEDIKIKKQKKTIKKGGCGPELLLCCPCLALCLIPLLCAGNDEEDFSFY